MVGTFGLRLTTAGGGGPHAAACAAQWGAGEGIGKQDLDREGEPTFRTCSSLFFFSVASQRSPIFKDSYFYYFDINVHSIDVSKLWSLGFLTNNPFIRGVHPAVPGGEGDQRGRCHQ